VNSLNYRIKKDLSNHKVFRAGSYIFQYEDLSLTVYNETLRNGVFMKNRMFVQGVNSIIDSAEFIESFLGKVA
jgi:hypothetical protein